MFFGNFQVKCEKGYFGNYMLVWHKVISLYASVEF